MAVAAGGIGRLLSLLVNVDFWMNLEFDHGLPHRREGHKGCQTERAGALKANHLRDESESSLSYITPRFGKTHVARECPTNN